jgi:UPF0716 protein FxsA
MGLDSVSRTRLLYVLRRFLMLLILMPVLELVTLLWLTGQTSWQFVLAWLLTAAGLGLWVLRSQGSLGAVRIRKALERGQAPGGALADSALVYLAGVLLVIPGVISDAIAILLLLPLTRRAIKWYFARRLLGSNFAQSFQRAGSGPTFDHDQVIDARVIDPASKLADPDE